MVTNRWMFAEEQVVAEIGEKLSKLYTYTRFLCHLLWTFSFCLQAGDFHNWKLGSLVKSLNSKWFTLVLFVFSLCLMCVSKSGTKENTNQTSLKSLWPKSHNFQTKTSTSIQVANTPFISFNFWHFLIETGRARSSWKGKKRSSWGTHKRTEKKRGSWGYRSTGSVWKGS